MSQTEFDRMSSSQLSEFIAFNEELIALIRAGLPLEVGLGTGEINSLSRRVGMSLRQGLSLQEALARERGLPATYRAVVETGLQAGDLPGTLARLSDVARVFEALRARLSLAAIYPSIIVIVGVLLTTFVSTELLHRVRDQFIDMRVAPPAYLEAIFWFVLENPTGWLYWVPAVLILLVLGVSGTGWVTLPFPGLATVRKYYRLSAFSELAASLLANQVPMEKALPLAARATGSSRLAAEATAMATDVQAGTQLSQAVSHLRSMPSFARWMIQYGVGQNSLPATFAHAGRWFHQRAERHAAFFQVMSPIVLTLFVGGLTLVTFATISFGPLIALFNELAGVDELLQ